MIDATLIHAELLKVCANNEIDHHCSDLYVKVKPETREIIANYKYKQDVEVFIDQITKTLWFDIPFAYMQRFENKEG